MAVDAHYHSKTSSSDDFALQLSDDSKNDGYSDGAFIDKIMNHGSSDEFHETECTFIMTKFSDEMGCELEGTVYFFSAG